ncbi:MAG: RnfH family protein [Gammaproteobacteria bacterium]|nr:RnfH family protein [Gammaproteobacteria bacterium]
MAVESTSEQTEQIIVEVAYAFPETQSLLSINVDEGCTAIEAVKLSGMADLYPDMDMEQLQLGIFSKSCTHEHILKAGERVEIYRPLIADPKEVRKKRAAEMAARKAAQRSVKTEST